MGNAESSQAPAAAPEAAPPAEGNINTTLVEVNHGDEAKATRYACPRGRTFSYLLGQAGMDTAQFGPMGPFSRKCAVAGRPCKMCSQRVLHEGHERH